MATSQITPHCFFPRGAFSSLHEKVSPVFPPSWCGEIFLEPSGQLENPES